MSELSDTLTNNYLLIDVNIRRYTGKRTDQEASTKVTTSSGAATNSAKVVKDLMAGARGELKAVASAQDNLRTYVYNHTLPWTSASEGRKTGARLLAVSDSLDFLARYKQLLTAYETALADFLSVYEVRKAQAMTNLGTLANPDDYPDVNSIASSFGITIDMVPCPAVSDFNRLAIPAEVATALGNRLAKQQETQVNNAMKDLGKRLVEELGRMATQLGKFGAGEKTKLYGSLITNMRGLVRLLKNSNFTDDNEITMLTERLDELVRYDIDVIKNNSTLAKEISIQADSIAADIEEVFY